MQRLGHLVVQQNFSPSLILSLSSLSPRPHLSLLNSPFVMARLLAFLSCGSNKNKKSLRLKKEISFQSNEKMTLSKLNSNISSKALSMVKLISWRKVQAEAEEEDDDDDDSDEVVWRKAIMMGERCRPLDFSGKIVYDSQGNLLPNSAHQDQKNNYLLH